MYFVLQINQDIDPRILRLKSSVQETYTKYSVEKKSISKIATERGLSINTIVQHLCESLQEGLHVDLKDLGVTKDIFHTVVSVIKSPPINSGNSYSCIEI